MSDRFRDAIAQGVLNGMDDWAGESDWQNFAANAVLDLPEMQAIRAHVRRGWRDSSNANTHIYDASDVLNTWLRNTGLPESVAEWALEVDA